METRSALIQKDKKNDRSSRTVKKHDCSFITKIPGYTFNGSPVSSRHSSSCSFARIVCRTVVSGRHHSNEIESGFLGLVAGRQIARDQHLNCWSFPPSTPPAPMSRHVDIHTRVYYTQMCCLPRVQSRLCGDHALVLINCGY